MADRNRERQTERSERERERERGRKKKGSSVVFFLWEEVRSVFRSAPT
jgi:hypothetical protein